MFRCVMITRTSTRALALTATLTAMLASTVVAAAPAHAYATLCGDTDSVPVASGRYIVQNNKWNSAGAAQCTQPADDGFQVTSGDHSVAFDGPPASYPSIYAGCHYGNCSSNSGLPVGIDALNDPTTSVSFHTNSGEYDASYDIWTDPTTTPSGQNHGSEIMIWATHTGNIRPAGSITETVTIAGAQWNVWTNRSCGDGCWNLNSFERVSGTTSLDIHLKDFVDESVRIGQTDASWYLTSVQFGFEPWRIAAGLGVDSFAFAL